MLTDEQPNTPPMEKLYEHYMQHLKHYTSLDMHRENFR